MGRPRKRHVQVELHVPKLDKNKQRRGGYRKGAGRKPNGVRAGASHAARTPIKKRHPQHITLRVMNDLGWLRRLDMYAAVRLALAAVLVRSDEFRIVHFSVQNTHIHLIVEASDQKSLANGIRAFQISAAKRLNAAYSRRRRTNRVGRVFSDRYHCENLDSVRQVRNALAYVINNWRRHGADDATYTLLDGRLDPYASGVAFRRWREAIPPHVRLPKNYEVPLVSAPTPWLLDQGLEKARSISMFEVPGPRRIAVVDN